MLTKVGQVSAAHLEELQVFCHSLIPLMTNDVSNYSPGRKRMWLFHEVNLQNGDVTRGYFDQRLWAFCQKVFPGCNVGLISYGGNGLNSDGLIGWHRDHSYSQPIARTVNLGESVFGYDLNRQGGNKQLFSLSDGEIIEFNCKHPHSLVEITSQIRFGINLWKLNEAKGFKPLF